MINVSEQGKPNNVTVITDGGKRVATIRRARAKTFLLALHNGDQPFTSVMFGTKTNCAVFTTRNKAIKEALLQIQTERKEMDEIDEYERELLEEISCIVCSVISDRRICDQCNREGEEQA